ncbi:MULTISPECIES: hypothetical protein [Corallincola]|uniref:Uncharacterized protein n=3 Tax=Corallincola TaxID=1775176 RepID=A0A368NFC2_9GAMM|nr:MULTISPECIES: hypothetical protein [Corallincola]RCU49178.1 hypothetical protein DU002_12560 [Corallincola holothuriorum]TAA47522.1 hypothetical protein EXY25_09890 [Corallincola spongiicola]TCI05204.1 hypothetical protein EZV61_04370 [Corallincola luteus]
MKHATQALLVSGVVLPGLAQVQLGKPIRGYVVMTLVVVLVTAVCINAVSLALEALEPFTRTGIMPDMQLITESVRQAIYAPEEAWMSWALWLLLACWIFAAVDGYLLGRAKDKQLAQGEKG